MKTRIIRIGKSRGIRIPKRLLEAADLHGEVELTARPGVLSIQSLRHPRAGWVEAFAEMAKRGDDNLLADTSLALSEWDDKEWGWE